MGRRAANGSMIHEITTKLHEREPLSCDFVDRVLRLNYDSKGDLLKGRSDHFVLAPVSL